MGYLWLSALLLIVVGFTAQAVDAWGNRPLGFLSRRNVHSRWWGVLVMGAGSMMSLGLWRLTAGSWSESAMHHQVALVLGGLWGLVSLVLAILSVTVPGVRTETASPSFPRPHGVFLFLGIGISIWLVWIQFTN